MDYRAFTVSAALAAGVVGWAPVCRADIVASDQGIAVRDAGVAAPARGMTMSQVASKFGDPASKVAAVGNPPISRWEYSGFVVYFERDHVIHAVVSESAPPSSSGSASAPAVEAPAPTSAPTAAPVIAPEPAPAPVAALVEPTTRASVASASAASVSAAPVPTAAPATAPEQAPAAAVSGAPVPGAAAAQTAPADSEESPQP